jgi:ankyrin repeat protein
LVRYQEDKEQQAILEWLTPTDYALQQNDFLKQRQAGSGKWLLDSAEFKSWLETKNQTLLCPGIPGAGKTILTSIVIEDLSTRFQDESSIVVAYIYCNFKRQAEQTLEDLLASVLKQLAQARSSLPQSVRSLYDRCRSKNTRPSIDDISMVLQSVAAEYSRVFVLVDALDECQVNNNCRAKLLLQLSQLQDKSGANLFMTSRFIPDIMERFERDLRIEIRANEHDVRRYIEGHLDELPRFVRRDLDLQQEISSSIVKAIDGMYVAPYNVVEDPINYTRFLLAQLHLNSLKGKRAPTAVRDALKKLPTGTESYDRAYSDAMERIEGQLSDEEALAKEALSWITCAKRPLTTTELQYALAIKVGQAEFDEGNKPDIEDIVSVCAGLVTIDEESGIIRLVHYTTQEYFERRQKHWFPTADFDITAICVTYLSFTVFGSGSCLTDSSFEERLQRNPLYDYAAHYWGHHACQIRSPHSKIVDFLQHEMNMEAATQAMLVRKLYSGQSDYSQDFPRQITGLHLSAYFGITEIAAILLDCADPNSKDTNDQTPLSWAAQRGHEGVVKLLLDTGKVDVNSKDTNNWTPLSWAAEKGHEGVVKLLLNTGKVDGDLKDTKYGQTPLSWAAENGHESVVKLLLDTGKVDVDLKDDTMYSRTPLLWAAAKGHEGVVKLLLDTGKVDVDLKDDTMYSRTPLLWAAAEGHEGVVKLLLDTGKVDVDLKDDTMYSRTPLSWAAENGHESVVKLLLNTGKVDVNLKDSSDQTPLLWAARNGHKGVVKLLLDTGKVDVDSKDDTEYGQTPLSWAAEKGHEGVVKLLLDTGKVNVNSKDTKYGQTPLSWAAEKGHEGVVKLLLDTGKVDVDSKDTLYSWTPLFWAAMDGHESVAKLLLDTGKVDVDLKDSYDQTPLWWAAENGHEGVVKLLQSTTGNDL